MFSYSFPSYSANLLQHHGQFNAGTAAMRAFPVWPHFSLEQWNGGCCIFNFQRSIIMSFRGTMTTSEHPKIVALVSTVDAPSIWPKDVRPPVTSFDQSLWLDFFTSFSLDDEVQEKYAEAIEALKIEARRLLIAKESTTAEKLVLIDTLERLGVAYHFEKQIEDQLQEIFKSHHHEDEEFDLFTTALQFRLLRQHRHHVSSNVFDKFKDEDNKFNENLSSDAKGLLSLYEAAHVRIHGEDILDDAVSFTTYHLNFMVHQLESPLKDQVKRALVHPRHRVIPRTETRYHISLYEKDGAKNEIFLELAKLDYNYLQNMYKKELCELSRWWIELDLKSQLPYTRDRIVEAYVWGLAVRFEPQYSYVRVAMAKSVQLSAILDDTYDNYATLAEADLLTEILQRWDIHEIDRLPNYMKLVYRFVLSIYEDYERDAAKQGKLFAVPYAKETVKQLAMAYSNELRWLMKREMPTFEEYLSSSIITAHVYFTSVLPGMKSASKETIDWLMSNPKILIATANICRILDDLAGYERESKGGNMLTAHEIYMKQHGLSIQETKNKFVELVEDGWKAANAEWTTEKFIAKDLVEQLLNYARAAELTYKNCQDAFTDPKSMEPHIVALFVDPIIM